MGVICINYSWTIGLCLDLKKKRKEKNPFSSKTSSILHTYLLGYLVNVNLPSCPTRAGNLLCPFASILTPAPGTEEPLSRWSCPGGPFLASMNPQDLHRL